MPIYEYSCRQCGAEFEKFVGAQASVACPSCASGQVIRRISLVGIRTGSAQASVAGVPQGGCCGGACGCH